MEYHPFCTSELTEDAVQWCSLGFLLHGLLFSTFSCPATLVCSYELILMGNLSLAPRTFCCGHAFLLAPSSTTTSPSPVSRCSSNVFFRASSFFGDFLYSLLAFFSHSCLSSLGQKSCQCHFIFFVLIARWCPGVEQSQVNCPVLFWFSKSCIVSN